MLSKIRNVTHRDTDSVFQINSESVPGVSAFDSEYYDLLARECELFRLIEVDSRVAGYICAMNRFATYDGDEFHWFQNHFCENFLYIDQVAVSQLDRGKGLGRALYDHLETHAIQKGIAHLTCEVNYEPINAASQVFHAQLGFKELGRLATRGVVVSLLAKSAC